MSDKDHSVVIQVKSGDRILTEITYPDQSYSEMVSTQFAIAMGLFRAGAMMAEAKGDPLPAPMVAAITGS